MRDAATELVVVADGIDHPEGVAWFGGAVWCGTEAGALLRIDPASGDVATVSTPGGFFLGLAFDGTGACYVCDAGGGRVLRVGPDGRGDILVDSVDGRRLANPNFPVLTRDGTLWVTDSGSGWGADDGFVFAVDPDGRSRVVDRTCGRFPNGMALSPDGGTLYVIESRSATITAFSIAGGALLDPRPVAHLPGSVPDGLAVDAEGALYVGCNRPDRVYRIGADGGCETLLDDPTGEYLTTPTNLAFGGTDRRDLYLASLGGWSIRKLTVDIPGAPLPLPDR